MFNRFVPFVVSILVLTGCFPTPRPLPTPLSIESLAAEIALTQAARTPSDPLPTQTPAPRMPEAEPTLAEMDRDPPLLSEVPVLAPTSTPWLAPEAAIQIHAPGPMSRVRSPIRLRGYLLPGYKNRVYVELIGEDGRLLARQLTYAYTSLRWAYLSVDIPFEIQGVAELGRLQVSTEDEFGRINALTSVHVLLLSGGYADINPPGSLLERCVLISPPPQAVIQGNSLLVEGYMRPFNDLPLIVELVATYGQSIATRLVSLSSPAGDDYVPFSTEVPFSVAEPTSVRLSVRQLDARIGGTMYVYSQVIALVP